MRAGFVVVPIVAALALVFTAVASGNLAPPRRVTVTVCASGCDYSTLAQALAAAGNGWTIKIAAGSYEGEVTIGANVALLGAGPGLTTITGPDVHDCETAPPLVTVNASTTAEIKALTLSGGCSSSDASMINNSGTLTLRNTAVTNGSGEGPAIFNTGALSIIGSSVFGNQANAINNDTTGVLTVKDSLISDNEASNAFFGGGIENEGTATIDGSTISGNGAFVGAGGIFNDGGTMTLNDSTVSNNNAGCTNNGCAAGELDGGGIYNGFGVGKSQMTVNNSTITVNSAVTHGGGIYNDSTSTITLNNSAVTSNSAGVDGGGIDNAGGTVILNGTTVSGNTPNDTVGI
jgi:hypothetical protein